MIDRRTAIGSCCALEMDVGKSKVKRISRERASVQIMIVDKQLENVECFNCLGSVIPNDARCRVYM